MYLVWRKTGLFFFNCLIFLVLSFRRYSDYSRILFLAQQPHVHDEPVDCGNNSFISIKFRCTCSLITPLYENMIFHSLFMNFSILRGCLEEA